MASPRRHWLNGSTYHITSRGNHKNVIFIEENDFKIYISLLKENIKFYASDNYQLLAFCLMNNHVHLLLKTDLAPPPRFISRLHSKYAIYFNNKYDKVGHLFQDRYYSETISDNLQLLVASRYIHLNPVRAGLTQKPEEYKWSSYTTYISNSINNLVEPNSVLSLLLSLDSKVSPSNIYKNFVEMNTLSNFR